MPLSSAQQRQVPAIATPPQPRARRAGQRWRLRRKAALTPEERSDIARRAALARWGKYTPRSQPARGLQQRLARPQKPAKARSAGKRGGGGGKKVDPEKQQRQQQDRAYQLQRRQQVQQDRDARLARQQQRDTEHQQDRARGAAERQAREQQRQQRDAERKRREVERQKKGGGGGGKKGGQNQERQAREQQRAFEQQQRDNERAMNQAATRQRQQQRDTERQTRQEQADQRRAQREQAQAARQQQADQRRAQRDQEQAARRQQADAQRAAREAGRRQQAQERERQRQEQAAERSRVTTPELADAARALSSGTQIDAATADALVRNGLARRDRDGNLTLTGAGQRATRQKASSGGLAVFKDRSGRLRWITRTTTAFQDLDGEILSTDALERASQRMKARGRYGPLRLWHIGDPRPDDPENPAGPGLDVGDCDTSVLVGYTLIESGTFHDERIGQAIAAKADAWEVSPGFFYDPDWRGPDGVFSDIDPFERSLVPSAHGRASNRFTGLAVQVKEFRMKMSEAEKQRRIKALEAELGVPLEVVDQQRQAAEKSALESRVAFKSAAESELPQIYLTPAGQPFIIEGGQVVALKAVGDAMDANAEAEPADDPEMSDGGETYVGDMTTGEFEDLLTRSFQAALATAMPAIGALDEQLKGMGYERRMKEQGDTVTRLERTITQIQTQLKEAQAKVAAVAKLEAQLKDAQGQLAELRGELPPGVQLGAQGGYRSSGDPATRLQQDKSSDAPVDPVGAFISDLPVFQSGAR